MHTEHAFTEPHFYVNVPWKKENYWSHHLATGELQNITLWIYKEEVYKKVLNKKKKNCAALQRDIEI